ncbi:MAG: bifunctional demethylmenaquinone methyltransferase/2-methoxy-6-polyprenyl-1,4-benzoquinol methylase UbiE [Myxococcota bacterium]
MSSEANPAGSADGSGRMFDGIARKYDLLNRINSLGMDKGWRRRTIAALEPEPGQRFLDLATGTADLAMELAERHRECQVEGLDPSVNMLEVGRAKVAREAWKDRVRLVEGDAQALGYPDESFDGVMMAFGIRNVPDRAAALKEMVRVLKPGGRAAILELSEPRNGALAWFARQHVRFVVPLTGALVSGPSEYKYLRTSIEAFPRPEDFLHMMEACGFKDTRFEPFTFGACVLYVGRR